MFPDHLLDFVLYFVQLWFYSICVHIQLVQKYNESFIVNLVEFKSKGELIHLIPTQNSKKRLLLSSKNMDTLYYEERE